MSERRSVKDNYALAMALAVWAVASKCQSAEGDSERAEKMARVLNKKWQLLIDAYNGDASGLKKSKTAVLEELGSGFDWDELTSRELIVDLLFISPFAPWELETKEETVHDGINEVAGALKVPRTFVEEAAQARKEATKAHRNLNVKKIVLFGLGGAILLGAGGWIAAPAIGAALGGIAGLSGAAATGAGLAALGGGSLAAGGAGMAGGMAVITGIGATGGAVAMGGSQVLLQLGARGAQQELIKLQTNYRAVLLHTQLGEEKAKRVVEGLANRLRDAREELAEERRLNDENSERLKNLAKIIESLENAQKFVKESA